MLKHLLFALCLGASATAGVGSGDDVAQIIKIFSKNNKKAKSIALFLKSNKSARDADVLGKLVKLELSGEKTLDEEDNRDDFAKQSEPSIKHDFSPIKLKGVLEVGLHTALNIQEAHYKYKKSLFSKEDPSIFEFEEIVLNYLKLRAQYTQKLALLTITQKYIAERRTDLNEYEIRAKHADASNDELAEGKAALAEAEASYKKLKSDVHLLFTELQYQLPNKNEIKSETEEEHKANEEKNNNHDNEEIESYDKLELADLEEFATNAKLHKPNSSIKAEINLKLANTVKLQSFAEFAPKASFGFENYLNRTQKEKADQRNANKITLGITMNIAPHKFFESLTACRKYEAAKNDFEYDQSKVQYELNKAIFEMQNEKDNAQAAYLGLVSKKATLNSAVLHYKGGTLSYAKLAQARTDYYKAAERYYASNERYIEKLIDYIKITGTLREMFLLEHNDL